MVDSSAVRFTGPLTEHREALGRELVQWGYTALSASNVLRVVAHLSRWLESQGLSLRELTRERLEAFFEARREAGYTAFLKPTALRGLLPYLEAQAGSSLVPAAAEPGAGSELLQAYVRYLLEERSLTTSTVRAYTKVAREFVHWRFADGPVAVDELCAEDLTSFVLTSTQRYRTGTTNNRVTALRAFVRYLYLEGALTADLTGAIPRAASWRLTGIPKAWDGTQLRRLLRSCDRRRRVGRRNYAVLLLLVRLGLRAGEVAALQLDDIDWAAGELRVRGKGRREARLPLPTDVGEALAAYLRSARPCTSPSRHVFRMIRAPHGPLQRGAVTAIVRQHSVRAGLEPAGAHRLRHTAATAMLRAGNSLDDIAQVLRHRSHDTTAIYAKVDRAALRRIARCWPGELA